MLLLASMEIASPGANGGPVQSLPPQPGTGIDASVVVDHLIDLLGITLGASLSALESHGSLLSKSKRPDTIQRCQRFASEAQVVLYVQKDLVSIEQTNGVNNTSGKCPCEKL